ncbi:MAG: type II toxin-antitoxin system VapC family toxin [Desulfococcaceae bacterium]
MILLDTDVMIDLLRAYPPAEEWFEVLDDYEILALPGFVMMELIQGCKNKAEQDRLKRDLGDYEVIWLSSEDCNIALDFFIKYHLSHNAGLTDVLVGQTAVAFGVPLYTFNRKHYQFIPDLEIVQPYIRI